MDRNGVRPLFHPFVFFVQQNRHTEVDQVFMQTLGNFGVDKGKEARF